MRTSVTHCVLSTGLALALPALAAAQSAIAGTCHGISAVAGVISDLRKSGSLHDAAQWRDIVLGGKLTGVGMPRFDEALTPEEAETIRAYVGRQAALAYGRARKPDIIPTSRK